MKLLSIDKLRTQTLEELIYIKVKVERFIWSAILDEKVCDLCRSLDSKVIDINSNEAENFKPPIHPKCRCHWIPITSDAEVIPEPNWEKPIGDLLNFAPFLYFLPSKKKEIEIDPNDIISIWDSSEAEQQIDEFEKEELILVLFLGKTGRVILETEVSIDEELKLINREIELIKEKASSYMISDDNDIIEDQIKKLFKLKKNY